MRYFGDIEVIVCVVIVDSLILIELLVFMIVKWFMYLFFDLVGYVVGYYFYKWVEVFDVDVFMCF